MLAWQAAHGGTGEAGQEGPLGLADPDQVKSLLQEAAEMRRSWAWRDQPEQDDFQMKILGTEWTAEHVGVGQRVPYAPPRAQRQSCAVACI